MIYEVQDCDGSVFPGPSNANMIRQFLDHYFPWDRDETRYLRSDVERLRSTRNDAAHPPGDRTLHPPDAVLDSWAVSCLFSAYRLSIWLARTFGTDPQFQAPDFVPVQHTVSRLTERKTGEAASGPPEVDDMPVIEGKYRGLFMHFARIPPSVSEVRMAITEVEALVPDGLAPSAHRLNAWWSGERPHTRAWRQFNWRASPVRQGDVIAAVRFHR